MQVGFSQSISLCVYCVFLPYSTFSTTLHLISNLCSSTRCTQQMQLCSTALPLKRTLLLFQDPAIKEMAEQIAKDPAFSQVTQQLQKSMTASPDGNPQIDPQQYMQAMRSVMENPQFVQMAEKLGSALMQVSMLHTLVAPAFAFNHYRLGLIASNTV